MHSSMKWLIGEVVIFGISFAILGMANYPLLLPYQWHKLLHIFGAVIFLGNIIITGIWMALAEQSKDKLILHFSSKVVNWADVFFTAPGVLLILANGLIMATNTWGGLMNTSWIALALGLFTLSGIVWVGFLLRYQHKMIQLSSNSVVFGEELPEAFFKVLHRWYFWGMIATILPLISLILMVVKPRFW